LAGVREIGNVNVITQNFYKILSSAGESRYDRLGKKRNP
jgi:hypothetical protein